MHRRYLHVCLLGSISYCLPFSLHERVCLSSMEKAVPSLSWSSFAPETNSVVLMAHQGHQLRAQTRVLNFSLKEWHNLERQLTTNTNLHIQGRLPIFFLRSIYFPQFSAFRAGSVCVDARAQSAAQRRIAWGIITNEPTNRVCFPQCPCTKLPTE